MNKPAKEGMLKPTPIADRIRWAMPRVSVEDAEALRSYHEGMRIAVCICAAMERGEIK